MLTCAEQKVVRVGLVLQTFAPEIVYMTEKDDWYETVVDCDNELCSNIFVGALRDELTPAGIGWVRCP